MICSLVNRLRFIAPGPSRAILEGTKQLCLAGHPRHGGGLRPNTALGSRHPCGPTSALGDLPQQVRQLDIRLVLSQQPSGPQPPMASALVALDLNYFARVVGQGVGEAH